MHASHRDELYVAVDAGTGAVAFSQDVNGTLSAWQAIAGITTNAPVAAQWIPDTSAPAAVP